MHVKISKSTGEGGRVTGIDTNNGVCHLGTKQVKPAWNGASKQTAGTVVFIKTAASEDYYLAETRAAITTLHDVGFSNGDIARQVGVSKRTVARWIQRYVETGDTLHRRGAGRPRCTKPAQDAAIADIIDNAPFTTGPAIRHQIGLFCTPLTIRNRHYNRDLHACEPAKKPELTDLDMERRMEYALEYA